MFNVRLNQSVRIVKHRFRFLEGDAVLPLIISGLLVVPIELEAKLIHTSITPYGAASRTLLFHHHIKPGRLHLGFGLSIADFVNLLRRHLQHYAADEKGDESDDRCSHYHFELRTRFTNAKIRMITPITTAAQKHGQSHASSGPRSIASGIT